MNSHYTVIIVIIAGIVPLTLCSADINWVQMSTEYEMPRTEDHSMVYNLNLESVIMFGGVQYPDRSQPLFLYNEDNWIRIEPTVSWPSWRCNFAMSYDSIRDVVVIFGGFQGDIDYLGDTWEWDGKNWEQKFPENHPSDRIYQTMIFDVLIGNCLLFGGYEESRNFLNDTWTWNGIDWVEIETDHAPSPRSATMVYDEQRDLVVLFGGTENGWQGLNDTWIFNGEDWMKLTPPDSPPKVYYHSMTYDSARGRCVVFGGAPLSGGFLDETWEFDGTTWEKITTQRHPLGRGAHAMCYDSIRHRTVLFGGYSWDGPERDTWEYYDVPTPTITPTLTITPTPTITPVPSKTPAYTETPTATCTPTATPTATAIPELGVSLSLSGTTFHANDPFVLNAIISNPGPQPMTQQPFALVLDIQGNYFWYPDWTGTFTVEPLDLPVGTVEKPIFNFLWPDVEGSFTGAMFYGALLSTDQTSILGNWGYAEFGW